MWESLRGKALVWVAHSCPTPLTRLLNPPTDCVGTAALGCPVERSSTTHWKKCGRVNRIVELRSTGQRLYPRNLREDSAPSAPNANLPAHFQQQMILELCLEPGSRFRRGFHCPHIFVFRVGAYVIAAGRKPAQFDLALPRCG